MHGKNFILYKCPHMYAPIILIFVYMNNTSHIDKCQYENHTVMDDAETFIRRVIIHCPDKNFKMTRRYGYYSNAYSKCLDHIYEIYRKQIKRKLRTKSQRKKSTKKARERSRYRMSMILTYGKDPIKCTCGAIMQPTFSYNPYKEGKLNERQSGSDRRRRSIHDRRVDQGDVP